MLNSEVVHLKGIAQWRVNHGKSKIAGHTVTKNDDLKVEPFPSESRFQLQHTWDWNTFTLQLGWCMLILTQTVKHNIMTMQLFPPLDMKCDGHDNYWITNAILRTFDHHLASQLQRRTPGYIEPLETYSYWEFITGELRAWHQHQLLKQCQNKSWQIYWIYRWSMLRTLVYDKLVAIARWAMVAGRHSGDGLSAKEVRSPSQRQQETKLGSFGITLKISMDFLGKRNEQKRMACGIACSAKDDHMYQIL